MVTIKNQIEQKLFSLQDEEYRNFQSKLIPTVEAKSVIGVRTPDLRKFAKVLVKKDNINFFLDDLPHKYFEENQLHAFIISETQNYLLCINRLDIFFPFVDNWATCDQMLPKVFKKNKKDLIVHIKRWIESDYTYAVRFAIGALKNHFLDDDFNLEYPLMVAKVKSDEYYVNMMIAWYFATALAKQYDQVISFIVNRKLPKWTHNKAIQKAIESNRITKEQKEYLKGQKI